MSDSLIVSASGIRGVFGEGLTPEVAARYGAAFGTLLAAGTADRTDGYVLVGRDSRVSGALLAEAATAGLRGAGMEVRDLGVAPTPTILLAAGDDERAEGALIVTASHNPIEWNGLKLAGADGRFLSREAGLRVQRLYREGSTHPRWEGVDRREPLAGAIDHHVERILALPLVAREAIARRRPLVALDCVRGAGGMIMPALLRRLGCDVLGLDLEPDGRFPRDPEPTAENLDRLSALVREGSAGVGLAVDPDADRLSLVDEGGTPIGEDWTLALAVEYVLSVGSGPVVTNLSSSQCIEDAAERGGALCLRTAVGEVNVAERMAEIGAVIGGEGNGGVILPRLHLTRDAPLAAALILSLIAERERGIGEMLRAWPRYHMVKRRCPRPSASLETLYRALRHGASPGADTDDTDGVWLAWPERREWVHVRPSGTEPILRVVAEAKSEARAERLAGWAESVAVGIEGTG